MNIREVFTVQNRHLNPEHGNTPVLCDCESSRRFVYSSRYCVLYLQMDAIKKKNEDIEGVTILFVKLFY